MKEPAPADDASQAVARGLQELIARRGLAPGDRLGREEDLAGEFAVSRPTLREALRILSSAHLIRTARGPGGGVFVAATAEQGMARSISELIGSMLASDTIGLAELLETRMLLEVPLAGLAARRCTTENAVRLRALGAELAAVAEDPEALAAVDLEIHAAVAEIAGNRVASAFTTWIAEVLLPQLRRRVAPAIVEQVVVDQQRKLVEAIAAGDATAAQRAMREHLTYTADLVTAVG